MAKAASPKGKPRATPSRDKGPEAPADPAAVWEGYHRSRSGKSRNALIEQYMPLVRAISARIAAELPNSVDTEDLISAGTFGLMDAIERYDPELGTRFEAYCSVRIRGAILDELRHLNWVPRIQCTRATKIGAATAALKGELGRTPTPREIASKAGLRVREVNRASTNGQKHVSLSGGPQGSDASGGRHIDALKAEGHCDPAVLMQEKERRDILAREVRKLPKAERLLVMLYYFEELTMKQVGEVLNVTESRVCQMHAGILALLQQRLARLNEPGAQGA